MTVSALPSWVFSIRPCPYRHPGTRRLRTRLQSQSCWAGRETHYRHKPGRTKPDMVQCPWLTGDLQMLKTCSRTLLVQLGWTGADRMGQGKTSSLPEGRGGKQCKESSLSRVPSMKELPSSLLRGPACPNINRDSGPQPCDLTGMAGETLGILTEPI
jgi:hypothetical protein